MGKITSKNYSVLKQDLHKSGAEIERDVNNNTNVSVTININFESPSNTGYEEESIAEKEMKIFYKKFC